MLHIVLHTRGRWKFSLADIKKYCAAWNVFPINSLVWHSPWRLARQLRGVTSVTKFAAVPLLYYIPTSLLLLIMKSMMTIVMKWTAVTPIKRVLHCLMDHPCWKEISRRKLWFPRSLVSHRGVLFIANLVEEKETAKPYKAWQSTGSYINK